MNSTIYYLPPPPTFPLQINLTLWANRKTCLTKAGPTAVSSRKTLLRQEKCTCHNVSKSQQTRAHRCVCVAQTNVVCFWEAYPLNIVKKLLAFSQQWFLIWNVLNYIASSPICYLRSKESMFLREVSCCLLWLRFVQVQANRSAQFMHCCHCKKAFFVTAKRMRSKGSHFHKLDWICILLVLTVFRMHFDVSGITCTACAACLVCFALMPSLEYFFYNVWWLKDG